MDYVNFIVSSIVAGLTAGILVTAIIGLNKTADQIEGATLYQIGQDGRQLTRDFRADIATVGDVLSYFHSVFLLHERGVIDDDGWTPIKRALCYFVKGNEEAKANLQKYADRYDAEFIVLAEVIEGAPRCV